MALTDTFVKNAKPTGKSSGEKYADGGGMYLLVKQVGKDIGKMHLPSMRQDIYG